MTWLIIVTIGVLLYVYIRWPKKPTLQVSVQSSKPYIDPLLIHKQAVTKAIELCTTDHPEATKALLWFASSDGSISKQEIRLLFRFCERFGTKIDKKIDTSLDLVSPKDFIGRQGSQTEAISNTLLLASKPIAYRVAFHGVAHAMQGGNKKPSKNKQLFLDKTESLIA
jgi:hypothetical protein